MSTPSAIDVGHPSDSAVGWLSPVAALERFQAPQRGLMQTGSLRSQEFARYGFRVAGIGLLVRQGTDAEVVETHAIAPIPLGSPWLSGVMNRRGHPVPVFSLRAALDLPPAESAEKTLVLVLDKGDDALGIEIESAPTALRHLVAADTDAELHPRLAPFATKAWISDAALWMEFDHAGFFGALVAGDDAH